MKRNHIDETVRQWLIWSITQSDVTAPAFCPMQNDVQLLAIDHILHCTKWDPSINSFHHIEFQPIPMDIWHVFCWNICLSSQSWWTCWQVLFVKRLGRGQRKKEEKCANPACEFVLIPGAGRTGMPLCVSTFVLHQAAACPFLDMLTFCTAHSLFFMDNQVNNYSPTAT